MTPLHPMVVHFPIVLALLVPLVAGLVAWGLARGTLERRAWLIPLVLQAGVFVSAWTAAQLGEQDEERVEAVVAEQALESHEELGEAFVLASGGLMLVMLVPLMVRTRLLPPLIAMLSLIGAVMVIQVGKSGGSLVYQHGAAAAFAGQMVPDGGAGERPRNDHHDDDD